MSKANIKHERTHSPKGLKELVKIMETERNLRACAYALTEKNSKDQHWDELVNATFDENGNITRKEAAE